MKSVDLFISPFQYSNNAKLQYSFLLNEAGFCDIQVEVKNKVFVYKDLKTFKGKLDLLHFYFQFYYLQINFYILDNMKAINPFIDRMPVSLQDNFMDDLINTVISLDLNENHNFNDSDCKFNIPYKLLVAYARKSF